MDPTNASPPSTPAGKAAPRPWLKLLGWTLGGLAAALAVVVVGATILLKNLDSAPVKRRVQAAARAAGVELDYGRVDGSLFSGLVLHDLAIASAPADVPVAPALLRIAELKVGWSPRALAGGTLGELRVAGLAATVVQDEAGGTSIERWNARRLSIAGPPPPSGPLSRLMADSLPARPFALERLRVEGATATLLRTRAGRPVERLTLRTLELSGAARGGGGRLDAAFDAGNAARPLAVSVVREALDAQGAAVPGSAKVLELAAWLRVGATAEELSFGLEVKVGRRELAPALPEGALLQAQARLALDPQRGRATAHLAQLSLVDGAATATAEVDLLDRAGDGAQTVLRAAAVHAALDQLAVRLRDLLPAGTRLEKGRLSLEVKEAAGVAQTRFPGTSVAVGEGRALLLGAQLAGLSLPSEQAPLRLRSLTADARAAGGEATLAAGLRGLAQGPEAHPTAELEQAALSASLKPAAGGKAALQASLPVSRAVARGARTIEASRLKLEVEGLVEGSKRFNGAVKLALGELRAAGGGQVALLRGLGLQLDLAGAVLGAEALASEAGVALGGRLESVSLAQGARRALVSGVGFALTTRLKDRALARTQARLPVERLELQDAAGGPQLPPQRALLELEVAPLPLEAKDPPRRLKATLALGPLAARADLEQQGSRATFDLSARAERLGPLAGLLRGALPEEERARWEAVGLAFESKGSASGLGGAAPFVDQRSHLSLQPLAVRREGLDLSARQVDLRLASKGTPKRQTFELVADLEALRVNGKGGEGREALSLAGSYDLDQPALALRLAGRGEAGPEGSLALSTRYDLRTHLTTLRADGAFSRLGLLGAALPAAVAEKHRIDWEKLSVRARAEADLSALVESYRPGLPPQVALAKEPLTALRGATAFDLEVTGLDYRGEGGVAAALPSIVFHLESRVAPARVEAQARLELPRLKARAAGHQVEGERLAATFALDGKGDLTSGTATARAAVSAGSLRQDAVPQYALGEAQLKLAARADASGAVRIEEASFDNPAGGTSLSLRGGVDLGPPDPALTLATAKGALARVLGAGSIPGRRNLLLEGQAAQRLEAVNATGQALGKGALTVPFRVESGDLSYVRASAALRFDDVDLELPASGLTVRGLNGAVPVVQDLLVDDQGKVSRLFGAASTAYARLRFTDQQPFLSGNPYVSARELRYDLSKGKDPGRAIVIGPLAGNVRVDRNLVAIDQLEAELSRGRVTGQVLVDGQGDATQVSFRGGVTGLVTQGSDERLDANAALVLWPVRRLLDGRIELVRLGTSHLRALLDLTDPYQADVAANRMRLALKFGYPKSARLKFLDGFMSLALELGGLAQAVRIDEMTGTPVGPILERYLAPAAAQEEGP